MSQIEGFQYESHSPSSGVARRDFRHTTSSDDFEKLPHKKWGKNHNKSSPNKKDGCPENDGQGHIYELIETVHKFYRNKKIQEHSTFFRECVGCGKRKKFVWKPKSTPYARREEEYYFGLGS